MEYFFIFILYMKGYSVSGASKHVYYAMSDSAFFSMPASQEVIQIANPDTLLLDVSIFHATNKARREAGLPALFYDLCLYKSSSQHAASMTMKNFYGHDNPHSPFERTVVKRVMLCTKRFRRIGENIGKYQTVISNETLSARLNKQTGRYDFHNTDDDSICPTYTYSAYAHYVVSQWIASPPHRANLLSKNYRYLGCAARLRPNPYNQRGVPYGSVVQNFANED